MVELYIDGSLVDLSEDTVIAINKQVNDIDNIGTIYGTLTNQFSIPVTKNNEEIFGLGRRPESDSVVPYSKLPVKLIDKGVELIQGGFAIIESGSDIYKVTIYNDNADIFSLIEGKLLTDLDFTEYDHTWNTETIVASRLNDDGYIYPIIDYGKMALNGNNIQTKELYPAFFIHTIIGKIFEDIGYTISGDILTDQRYIRLLLAWSLDDFVHSDEQLETFKLNAVFPTTQNFSYVASSGNQIYDVDLEDSLNVVNGKYVVPGSGLQTFEFVMEGTYTTGAGVGGGEMNHQIYNYTTSTVILVVETVSVFNPSTSGGIDGTLGGAIWSVSDAEVSAGDEIGLRILVSDVGVNISINVNKVQGSNESFFRNVVTSNKILTGSPFKLSDQLPEISQVDFLKNILSIFGGIVVSESFGKTAEIVFFDNLINNDSVDMTSKYVDAKDDGISYAPSNLFQENIFSYVQDKSVSINFGNSSIFVSNDSLPLKGTIVSSLFGSSQQVLRLQATPESISVPLIKKVSYAVNDGIQVNSVEQQEFESTSLRLVVLDRRDNAYNIDFLGNGFGDDDVTENNDIAFCYFSKESADYNLDWETLIDEYYQVYEQIIQNYKKMFCNFILKAPDVYNFDHFTSWYVDKYSARFFPMKISNYKNGEPTTVELIKI